MLNLTGYQETETLYTGTRTLVYRATRLRDQQPVIIKVLQNSHPHFNELVGFRNQYVITQNLDSPFIVKPLALERYANGYALVMPDEGAVPLSDYWPTHLGQIRAFLSLALQLAQALHALSQERIIHKDIKPANILIHPDTQQVQLIDFSIASLLPKEQQQLVNPNGLEGTLAYISPEQTGRMNRGIDYRTDFYSLGVTLYELLLGELPFESNDPLELIHSHIAQAPLNPHTIYTEQGALYPQTLSAIILKLMAKNAEDRYQSALGLKYDLERCVRSLESTGAISEFELGERDVCDRFIIPEKLYGREQEVQTLLDAFERVANGNSEMILVAGFSGIGKTAVVNEVHKPIVEKRGYFIKGKFDQFNRNIPFSAFVQAFRELMGQLLSESDEELVTWKSKLLKAVGENGQVLIDVIPELERVIGSQPEATELSGTAAQNRFNLLFQKFIALFTTPEHPLVLFLDDLQWADSASLNLMKVLMSESEDGHLLLLGAHRDNEVFPAHPLMLTLSELDQPCDPAPAKDARERPSRGSAEISTITLAPLPMAEVNRLVAETLNCASELAQSLAELVYQKTKGNPFFSTQFLKGLYEDKLIVFNAELGYWECDLVQVREAALTDDVVEFMARRLLKLPEATQGVLKLAACIGNQFDLETLAIVRETTLEETAAAIWSAIQEGIIIPLSEAYKFSQSDIDSNLIEVSTIGYRFLHDRIQQASYALILEEDKKYLHLSIGRLLLKSQSHKREIFQLANQFNKCHDILGSKKEVLTIALLNRVAAQKARETTAFSAVVEYAKNGLKLLGDESWERYYDLTLDLKERLSEASYLSGDFDTASIVIDDVLDCAKTIEDCLTTHEIKLQSLKAQGQFQEAIKLGLSVLKTLDIDLPTKATPQDIEKAFLEIEELLGGRRIAELSDLPEMSDRKTLAATRLIYSLLPVVHMAQADLLPILIFQQIKLALRYGNAPAHPHAYAGLGLILCAFQGDIQRGYEAGQLALDLLNKLKSEAFRSATTFVATYFTFHWKQSIQSTLKLMFEAYVTGLETGDIEHASYSAERHGILAYFSGSLPLSEVSRTMEDFTKFMQSKQQHSILQLHNFYHQVVLNWQGYSDDPFMVIGTIYDESKTLPQHIKKDYRLALFYYYLNKVILGYYFYRSPKQILAYSEKAKAYIDGESASILMPLLYTYDSLVHLVICSDSSPEEKSIHLQLVAKNQEKLKFWASHAPMNYQHKYDLIEAEKSRLVSNKFEAIEYYDRAIAGAKENGYLQEEALANELTAKFYLDWGKEKYAALHMQEAYYCYARWEAKAKTDHLEINYPELLTPILQKQRVEFNPLDSLSSLTQTLTATLQRSNQTSTNISEALDFAAILRAAQKLSSAIELDQLLGDIVEIILTTAGAKKMVLLAPDEQQWQLQASAELMDEGKMSIQTPAEPLTPNSPVPIRLVQYVKNTQEPVLISEAKTKIPGILEGYLLKHQPQSVFCVPLLNQGELVAIAYLEHPTTKGVFTPNRQTIVEFLCAQAAVALQNARLYQQAQTALTDLQQAQLQLVQSEKMSALGNLVAGVAHEINNPVGFLQGNIQPAQEYVQDLLGLIDVYQAEYPQANETVDEEAEAIDLEFVREDLPKLISSMNAGVERIRDISNSLRTFSRQDQDHKTAFKIHDGIDSTLLILKHRTKANEQRPQIEVLKNYDELPEVQCFPGQLNQVFMNILANAIDAFEEANQGKTFKEIAMSPNTITIATAILNEQVQIQIQDNGCGMKPETVERIFEQGFTTKAVGKGTGLGMAIAYQIITEKHGGTIQCESTLGQGTIFTLTLPLAAD